MTTGRLVRTAFESVLELYRAALRVRRSHPALGDGTLRWLDALGEPTGSGT